MLRGDSINTKVEYGQSVSCDNVGMSSQELEDSSDSEDDDSVRVGWTANQFLSRYTIPPSSEGLDTEEVAPYFPFSKALIFEEVVGRNVFSHTLRSGGCSADCMVSFILHQLLLECGFT